RSKAGTATSSTRAPSFEKRASAAWNAFATVGSRSSSADERGTSKRKPFASSCGKGAGASPARIASYVAQHATELASGPTESSVNESGNAPSRGTRRAVGFQPVTPHNADGPRIEPRVSDPSAITH